MFFYKKNLKPKTYPDFVNKIEDPLFNKSNRDNTNPNQGFSLIELLVTIAVFVIITGIIFFNFNVFSSVTVLDNLAHEIALTIRQAQVFGISIQELSVGSEIFPGYGVHFDLTQNKLFILFADTYPPGIPVGDGKYEKNNDTLIEQYNLQKGNRIDSICGFLTTNSSCDSLMEVHITFLRPNPEANIIGINFSAEESSYSYTRIIVSDIGGEHMRTITVWSNGQISVQPTTL